MPYAPPWTNADPSGRVVPGEHVVRLSDPAEIAAEINRRRRLTYQPEQDFSGHLAPGERVRRLTFEGATAPPFDDFRVSLNDRVLTPPAGTMGGSPPTPTSMAWLWPEPDADEGKIIVPGDGGVGDGEVGLTRKLNGTCAWTDPDLGPPPRRVRAVHVNELRQAVEWLRRGRWDLPVYFACGIFSALPDTPWVGDLLANNGTHELRCVATAVLSADASPVLGLTDVSVRDAARLEVTADADCVVEARRCLRAVDFAGDPPTWNEYAPGASAGWSAPGGAGAGDAELIGSLTLTAGQPGELTGPALTAALQAMIDGAEQNFLFRRADAGPETIAVSGRLVVEFDLM